MKNLMIEYDAESVRWMGYHIALKNFFESVAGLPNIPANEENGLYGKNVKVIYATPSSAFTKHVLPLVNGLAQRPIISYYLSSEETVEQVAGSPFLINRFYYKDEDGNYVKKSFTRPLMKSLTYTCNVFATKMSDCDYILTLLELNCNKYRPYSCKVNNRPAQFYLDNVETGTPTDYEGKKFVNSSFTITVPLASIAPAEIETNVDVIKRVNAYLSGDSITLGLEKIEVTEPPAKTEYHVGEKLDLFGMVVKAVYSDGHTEVIKNYMTEPENGSILESEEITEVIIHYEDKMATQNIVVSAQ